jgi:endonuclease/exonuclease/phosphatase (EEP) superfamily protein YafD
VLLQEVPAQKEDLKSLAHELCNNSEIAYGPDCAIIARGKLEQIELPKPQNIFMTAARIRLDSGIQIEVFSLRLQPPVIDMNLFSMDCWRSHTKDRQSRRKQIHQVIEQMNTVSKYFPVILGGDFNVSAHDGCLDLLDPYLKDTFVEGGVGWGHTAINSVPLFRVDQIWANSYCEIISIVASKTVHSDHRMVICKLTIQ